MDWKCLDGARRSVGPVEVDLIEAYAQGRINRRDFVKRGTIIGLSMPFMGAIIAACGSDGDSESTGDTTAGTTAGTTAEGGTSAPPSGTTGGNLIIALISR